MNCPRCRKSNIGGAAFCMHCGFDIRGYTPAGQPVNEAPVPPRNPSNIGPPSRSNTFIPPTGPINNSAAQTFHDTQNKQTKLAWIAGTIALVAAIFLGIGAYNLLSATGKQPPKPSLDRSAKAPVAPSLMAQAQQTPPNLAVERSLKIMPPEIRAWLEHLEETERRRAELASQGLARVMSLVPAAQMGMDMEALKALASGEPDAPEPKTATDTLKEGSDEVRRSWSDLMQFYTSVRPPQECLPAANAYHHAVQETGAMIGDIIDALNTSKENPQAALESLYGMKNTSTSIDKFGKETDDRVTAICNKYETKKWFSIQADFGNTNLLGAMGR